MPGRHREIARPIILAREEILSSVFDGNIEKGLSNANIMISGTAFTVTLRYFRRSEALTIIGVMAGEFPGYQDHDLIALDSIEAQYLYVTSATRAKILEWLNILLGDMGFEPDDIEMNFNEDDITIEKTGIAAPGADAE